MQKKEELVNSILTYLSKQTGIIWWEQFEKETGVEKNHWILSYMLKDLGVIRTTMSDISITPRGMFYISE